MNKIGNREFLCNYTHSQTLLQKEVGHGKMRRTRSMERLSNSPPDTPKTTPEKAEKATKPGVLRTRSSGNGQAGEQSFESQSNSIIDLTSSPEAPNSKQVKMKAAL